MKHFILAAALIATNTFSMPAYAGEEPSTRSAYAYEECRRAPCIGPALALGTIALAAAIAVILQNQSQNGHGHCHGAPQTSGPPIS